MSRLPAEIGRDLKPLKQVDQVDSPDQKPVDIWRAVARLVVNIGNMKVGVDSVEEFGAS